MQAPDGAKLYTLLVDLLADQEGVRITYELENEKGEYIPCRTTSASP